MTTDYSFLEYSFNPFLTDPELVYDRLKKLGYQLKTQHVENPVSLWNQGLSIMVVRETDTLNIPATTGIGLVTSDDVLDSIAAYDDETDMYLAHDPNGSRLLMIPETEFYDIGNSNKLKMRYKGFKQDSGAITPGLTSTTAIRYNTCDEEVLEFYEYLGFKRSYDTDNYVNMISHNNKFSIMFNKNNDNQQIDKIVCDTHDVFVATAYFSYNQFDTVKFDVDSDKLKFGKMNHKIMGYGCLGYGNEKSYSVENVVVNALSNLDLVYRMRKQYFKITEDMINGDYTGQ